MLLTHKKSIFILILWLNIVIGFSQFKGHSGLYYLGTAEVAVPSSVYENPSVSGVVCRFRWDAAEPEPGVFNWSFVDAELAKAKAANKKLSLQPLGIPRWMTNLPGIEVYYYIDKNQYHPTYGDILSDVIPWSKTYLEKLDLFIEELARKYASDSVISYINYVGGYISRGLPDSVVVDTNLKTVAPFWTTFNYNADTLAKRMYPQIDTYMSLFPHTPLWCSVDYVRFEAQASGRASNYLANLYTAYGISKYPDRFGLFREDIGACTSVNPPAGSQWSIMKNNTCRTGAQMLWSVQDGPERMNKCGILPNTKQMVLDSAISKALYFGMRYVEVYGADVTDTELEVNIEDANSLLRTRGSVCNANSSINLINTGHATALIYPNPASSNIIFNYNSETACIYDLHGRIRWQGLSKTGQELDISFLENGIYFLKINSRAAKFIIRK